MSARTICSIALLGLAAAGAACSSPAATTPTPVSTTVAALQSVAPVGGATGVTTSGPMTMTFSGAMGQGMEQFVDLHHGDTDGPVLPMACAWSADRMTLICRPGVPMDPDDMYTLHMGGGMLDASGMRMNMDRGLQMGGQRLSGTMMGGMHAGQPMSMLGSGWHAADGSYGMKFSFRTGR